MTREEQEKLRHENFIKKLEEAETIADLPKKINNSNIADVLRTVMAFKDGSGYSREYVADYINPLLIDEEYLTSEEFRKELYSEISTSLPKYPRKEKFTEEEIQSKIDEVVTNVRLINHLSDAKEYDKKYSELLKKEKTFEHNFVMERITNAKSLSDLPNGGISNITKQIAKTLYDAFKKEKLKSNLTGAIANYLFDGKEINGIHIQNAIRRLCEEKEIVYPYNLKSIDKQVSYITKLLNDDFELQFIAEEIRAKDKKTLEIYKADHDLIMDQISKSNRISEMPTGLSVSKITSYLSANSLIYSNGKTISSGDFNKVAELLLKDKKMSDPEVQTELREVINKNYDSNKSEAFSILKGKLSNLPRLDYYVEEVKYGTERQQEFIARGSSNVNVYFIPNPNTPPEGGNFYMCYISRKDEVLELEKVVPEDMDVEDIEKYIRENVDPTFKTSGAVILNRDEKLGEANVYRPSGGPVGITEEEKENYEQLETLSKRLNALHEVSKKSKDEFKKLLDNYIQSQAAIEEEVNAIQEGINSLTDAMNKKKGLK